VLACPGIMVDRGSLISVTAFHGRHARRSDPDLQRAHAFCRLSRLSQQYDHHCRASSQGGAAAAKRGFEAVILSEACAYLGMG